MYPFLPRVSLEEQLVQAKANLVALDLGIRQRQDQIMHLEHELDEWQPDEPSCATRVMELANALRYERNTLQALFISRREQQERIQKIEQEIVFKEMGIRFVED